MKVLRALVAIGSVAAMLAISPVTEVAQAADKSTAAVSTQAKKPKPASYPVILVLCRPYQTCPP